MKRGGSATSGFKANKGGKDDNVLYHSDSPPFGNSVLSPNKPQRLGNLGAVSVTALAVPTSSYQNTMHLLIENQQ
ncbi:MAG: hypothetical protein AAF959_01040, partial [Cyanobacteria bacterium P01_D01_bin.56]